MEWTCNSPSMIDYQSQWKNPEAQIPETVKLLKINVEHDLECSLETVESPQQTLFDYPRIHMFNNRHMFPHITTARYGDYNVLRTSLADTLRIPVRQR